MFGKDRADKAAGIGVAPGVDLGDPFAQSPRWLDLQLNFDWPMSFVASDGDVAGEIKRGRAGKAVMREQQLANGFKAFASAKVQDQAGFLQADAAELTHPGVDDNHRSHGWKRLFNFMSQASRKLQTAFRSAKGRPSGASCGKDHGFGDDVGRTRSNIKETIFKDAQGVNLDIGPDFDAYGAAFPKEGVKDVGGTPGLSEIVEAVRCVAFGSMRGQKASEPFRRGCFKGVSHKSAIASETRHEGLDWKGVSYIAATASACQKLHAGTVQTLKEYGFSSVAGCGGRC